jgi:hypothetical protein
MSAQKKIFGLIVLAVMIGLVLAAASCNSNPKSNSVSQAMIAQLDTNQHTTINWKDTIVDFGRVNEGEKLTADFVFTNTGNKPLFLFDVHPSCGCTVPDYTHEPVAPGASSTIRVQFNTDWHPGSQRKMILVRSNTRPKTSSKLILAAEVIKRPKK